MYILQNNNGTCSHVQNFFCSIFTGKLRTNFDFVIWLDFLLISFAYTCTCMENFIAPFLGELEMFLDIFPKVHKIS